MKCVHCGNPKKLFEKFTSYGFCQTCHQNVKSDIEARIAKINHFLATSDQISEIDLPQKVDFYLQEITALEKLRADVPMFKSSLSEQMKKLTALRGTHPPCADSDKANLPISESSLPEQTKNSTSSQSTHQAFVIPEKIDQYEVRYLYKDVWVMGTQHAAPDFSRLQLCQKVTLVPDPTNEHDPRAVKVMCGDQFIGHISRKMDRIKGMVFDWHKKGIPIFAGITSIDQEKLQINLGMGFYLDSQEVLNRCETFSAKLTKTSKNDWEGTNRQEHLFWLNPGDILDASYDYETQTFILTDGLCHECGELSKSLSERLLEDHSFFPYVIVEDVTTDDDDKYSVSVKVYLKPVVQPH